MRNAKHGEEGLTFSRGRNEDAKHGERNLTISLGEMIMEGEYVIRRYVANIVLPTTTPLHLRSGKEQGGDLSSPLISTHATKCVDGED